MDRKGYIKPNKTKNIRDKNDAVSAVDKEFLTIPKLDLPKRSRTEKPKRIPESLKRKVKKKYEEKNRNLENLKAGKGNQKITASKHKSQTRDQLKIIPIGGLKEIGKNMTLLQYKDEILIIDCGLSFPEVEMYGIDVVIPDFTYVFENAKKVVGIVLTHGHEDHIGALPYLLSKINVPVYGTGITLGLLNNKLKERNLKADLRPVKAGDKIKIGNFKIETIRTTHSVADAICLYIQTPVATLFHTGDFKVDFTPIDGEPIDLRKYAEVGKRGVDILLSDSTNVLRPGYTKSEKVVGETLDSIIREAKGRIIIATFSSNVHRVQKIIELTHKYGRYFTVSGRSMDNVVKIAGELGYLNIPEGSFIELKKAHEIDDEKMVIITTGTQGEPMAALSRMAKDEHKNVKLKKGDTVILSSTPVPGNEKTVSNVVNKLYEKGVNVIYNDIADIHVSGHASQEDLKLIHSLIKPKFFMPVHGESRHLVEHARLAESLGMRPDRIFILKNGDALTLDKRNARKIENVVAAEDILVDGLGVGDVGNSVLNDRKSLSESGLIIVACTVNMEEGIILSVPNIISKGFVYVKENAPIIKEAQEESIKAIENAFSSGIKDKKSIDAAVKNAVRKFIYKKVQRSPIIIPVIIEQ